MSKEDELAAGILENVSYERAETEVHYNHYGSRGVVDVVLTGEERPNPDRVEEYMDKFNVSETTAGNILHHRWANVVELKSPSAVANSTGANEIIRQFKRHREYFFAGSNYDKPQSVQYWLVFYLNQQVFNHVESNKDIYENLNGNSDVRIYWMKPESKPSIAFYEDGGLASKDDAVFYQKCQKRSVEG